MLVLWSKLVRSHGIWWVAWREHYYKTTLVLFASHSLWSPSCTCFHHVKLSATTASLEANFTVMVPDLQGSELSKPFFLKYPVLEIFAVATQNRLMCPSFYLVLLKMAFLSLTQSLAAHDSHIVPSLASQNYSSAHLLGHSLLQLQLCLLGFC